MRLVTVQSTGDGREFCGVLREDGSGRIVDLERVAQKHSGDGGARYFRSMLHMIEGGDPALALAREMLELADRGMAGPAGEVSVADVIYRTPIPDPPQIRDCLMFEDHLLNAYEKLRVARAQMEDDPEAALKEFEAQGLYQVPDVWYERPIYYKANRFAVIGTGQDIEKPLYTEMLDFELEFGCFLKRRVKNASEEQAKDGIFGYSIFNDVSARDIQSREMQGQLGPAKGKDFDTANVIGPCIATADSIDPRNLTMIARINGEEVARGNSGTAKWSFERVIAYMSISETLVPGEFVASGTVGGGCGLEIGRFLEVGDVIELELEGIGVLRNRIVDAGAQLS